MDDDEIEHITANKSKLIRMTKCGPLLFSGLTQAGVMDDFEVAKIKKCGTDFEQAEALYDLLIAKTAGYAIILKVFEDTKQSGALKILKSKPTGTTAPSGGTDSLVANSTTTLTTNQLRGRRNARDMFVTDEDTVQAIKTTLNMIDPRLEL